MALTTIAGFIAWTIFVAYLLGKERTVAGLVYSAGLMGVVVFFSSGYGVLQALVLFFIIVPFMLTFLLVKSYIGIALGGFAVGYSTARKGGILNKLFK